MKSFVSFIIGVMLVCLLILSIRTVLADSATWKTNPGSGDWNTASNWTPSTIPNGPSDTATFAASNTTGISISDPTEVNGIVFNVGASPFNITVLRGVVLGQAEFAISGVGITNNSGITQNFVTAPASGKTSRIGFFNSATAGSLTEFINKGGTFSNSGGGETLFIDQSAADNSMFTNEGAAAGGLGQGRTIFLSASTAENSTFTNNGGAGSGANGGSTLFGDNAITDNCNFTNNSPTVGNARGGETIFIGTSTAGNSIFTNYGATLRESGGGQTVFAASSTAENSTSINNGATVRNAVGGETIFRDRSNAGNTTLIANGGLGGPGGVIRFFDRSSGGTARVEVFGNGSLDISVLLNAGDVTVGSIEGDGNVFLGARNLIVGSNNVSTNFSGTIQDGGYYNGIGGSLTKIGTGKLVLSHRNTYTGGTTVNRGRLVVNTRGRSGTGSGPVQVNRGRLAGMGTIAGTVVVGSGSGLGAVLSPGYHHGSNPGTLTIGSPLTFNSDATYEIEVNSSRQTADKVVAFGVTINSGAQTLFADLGNGTFAVGSVFTVIDNTSASPIAGVFSNLPDGSTFTVNSNTYRADYEGGDGNDLTLTVVP